MTWVMTFVAAVLGLGAGWLHFGSLRTLAPRIIAGQRRAIFLQLARLLVLGFLLFLAAKAGAFPLLAAASGILIARAWVMRGAA